jgi:pyruvate dehydrogenase E1 component
VAELGDNELLRAIRDLAGHDLADLLDAFAEADAVTDRPSIVFAYTIKAWRLATQGHPANHSALLSAEQWRELAADVGADPEDPWAPFPEGSTEAELCAAAAARLVREDVVVARAPRPPAELGRKHAGNASTQQAFGRFFVDLSHSAPEVAKHVVTVSPDVASSTNLGGWINRAGIWHVGNRIDWFADATDTLVRWRQSTHGQHMELGIAEGNLVGLLGELGATWSRDGQALLPIGTIYDPFVNRALEPWSFGMYAGGQSILVGTPSGVTLHRLGAGVRAGSRVDAAARALPARPPGRDLRVLPAHDATARPEPLERARGQRGPRSPPSRRPGRRLSTPHR